MEKIASIALAKIVRNTPDSMSPTGALLEGINIRQKDNAIRFVGKKKPLGISHSSADAYNSYVRHNVLPANEYIAYNQTKHSIYRVQFDDGVATPYESKILTLSSGEVFKRVVAFANSLLVFTDKTKYILYYDKTSNEYKDLSYLPIPVLNVEDSANDVAVIRSTYADPSPVPDYGFGATLNLAEYHRITMVGEYDKEVSQQREENRIHGIVTIRAAFKLFDGSYINHSQPLIYRAGSFDSNMVLVRSSGVSALNDVMFAKMKILYSFFSSINQTIANFDITGIVESIDFFVSQPVNYYNPDLKITKWRKSGDNYYAPLNTEGFSGEKIADGILYKVHSIPISELIKSGVHSTTATYLPFIAGTIIPDLTKDIRTNPVMPIDNFSRHIVMSECEYEYNKRLHVGDVTLKIGEAFNTTLHSKFYALKDISAGYEYQIVPYSDLDDYDMMVAVASSSTFKIYQQVWIGTEYGRKVITSELPSTMPYTYAANTTPVTYRYPLHSKFSLVQTTGTVKTVGIDTLVGGTGTSFTTEYAVGDFIWVNSELRVVTSITSDVLLTVNFPFAENLDADVYKYQSTGEYALILNPYLAYPDYRATKLRYYYVSSGVKYFLADFDLTANTSNNIAYKIAELNTNSGNGYYKPFIIPIPTTLSGGLPMPTDNPSDDIYISDTNRMQVSGVFNALVWPSENSYRFGLLSNRVQAISGVQSQMSDNAFGRYPLYVFSHDGTFTIEHGTGIVLYASIQPLNNDKLTNKNALLSVSGAIIFCTDYAVKIISGSQVQDVSVEVKGSIANPLSSNAYFNDMIGGERLPVVDDFLSTDFITFIKSAVLLYDEENKEVIFCKTNMSYSYVYSLITQAWFTRSETFGKFALVNNTNIGTIVSDDLVEAITIHTTSLYDMSQELQSLSGGIYSFVQTRPLLLDNVEYKNIMKMIVIADTYSEENKFNCLMVAGSNNCKNWTPVAYNQYASGLEGLSTMELASCPGNFKYYIFCLATNSYNFAITSITVHYNDFTTNTIQ